MSRGYQGHLDQRDQRDRQDQQGQPDRWAGPGELLLEEAFGDPYHTLPRGQTNRELGA
jgi:hypothetical protein